MKVVWTLLVRFLGAYVATVVLVLGPICLISLGLKWAFNLDKVLSNEEILQVVGVRTNLDELIIKDDCYSFIDGHGCEFVQHFSKEKTQEITKILGENKQSKDFGKSLIEDRSKNNSVFTKELYRLEPYPVDITVSWDSLNREVVYRELNGQWTKSLNLVRLFDLIDFIPKEALRSDHVLFLKEGTLVSLSEIDNKNLVSFIQKSGKWGSFKNGDKKINVPVFVKGCFKYKQLVLYNQKHGLVYFVKRNTNLSPY